MVDLCVKKVLWIYLKFIPDLKQSEIVILI
jgi:hypothetical protein